MPVPLEAGKSGAVRSLQWSQRQFTGSPSKPAPLPCRILFSKTAAINTRSKRILERLNGSQGLSKSATGAAACCGRRTVHASGYSTLRWHRIPETPPHAWEPHTTCEGSQVWKLSGTAVFAQYVRWRYAHLPLDVRGVTTGILAVGETTRILLVVIEILACGCR